MQVRNFCPGGFQIYELDVLASEVRQSRFLTSIHLKRDFGTRLDMGSPPSEEFPSRTGLVNGIAHRFGC
jgi:hypothetical protein